MSPTTPEEPEYSLRDEVKSLILGDLNLDDRWAVLEWLETGGLAELKLATVEDAISALGGKRGSAKAAAERFHIAPSTIHTMRDRASRKE